MDTDNLKNRYDYVETVLHELECENISRSQAVADLAEALKIALNSRDQLDSYMLGFKQRWQIDADQCVEPIIIHAVTPAPPWV